MLTFNGGADEAVTVADSVLLVDPWAEVAHRAAILAHVERDDPSGARRAALRGPPRCPPTWVAPSTPRRGS